MAFDKPQSRNEAILQNMLGANNELEPPKSRVEALLQDIAGQMPEANPSEGTTTGTLERLKIGDDIYTVEGGGSGTSDYDALNNKPQIAGVTLSGDKSLADLGIASATAVSGILDGTDIDSFGDVETALCNKVDKVDGKGLSSNDFTDAYKTAIGDNTTAINGIKNGEEINSFGGVESALALKQNATDNNLDTEAKTIVGAINEHEGDIGSLKSGLTDLSDHVDGSATTYPYADVITVEDAVPANLADCSVKVEPVQDLHGYDKPWVGGAGKNKYSTTAGADAWNNNNASHSNDNGTLVITYNANMSTPGVYADSGNVMRGLINGASSDMTVSFSAYATTENKFYIGTGSNPKGITIKTTAERFFITFSVGYSGGFVIYQQDDNKIANTVYISDIQVETGSTATDFAPYTNICPISGHTEAVVTRDGKNLFDKSTALAGYMLDVSTGEVVSGLPSTYVTDYIRVFSGKTVYIPNAGSTRRCFYDSNKVHDNTVEVTTAFTPSKDGYIRITGNTSDASGISVDDLQIEYGSTATTYQPYAGQQYTFALGDTIYGGTIRIGSDGKVYMDVDRALVDLSTISNWGEASGGRLTSNILQRYVEAPSSTEVNVYCETYKPCSSQDLADDTSLIGIGINSGKLIVVRTPDGNAPSDGNLCYVLATPFTIQLTPQQIQLLQGTNTLYASTGDISVTVNGVSGAIGAVQEQVNEKIAGDVYSATGVKIGTWLGEDLYRKVVSLGVLPNDDTKLVSLLIANDEKPLFFTAFATNAVGNVQPLPYVDDYAKSADVLCDIVPVVDGVGFNMRIITAYDKSSYNGYCILYYTKTT